MMTGCPLNRPLCQLFLRVGILDQGVVHGFEIEGPLSLDFDGFGGAIDQAVTVGAALAAPWDHIGVTRVTGRL